MDVIYRLMKLITDLFDLRTLLFPGNHRRFSDGFNWRFEAGFKPYDLCVYGSMPTEITNKVNKLS